MSGFASGFFSNFFGGFFSSPTVVSALIVGTVVAVVTALAGVFTVIRGQSFAAHALADLGAVGGAAAFLVGVSQLWGFVAATLLAGAAIEAVGLRRIRGRDVATGIVFGLGLGLTALLLYFDTVASPSGNATMSVLFGSLFALPNGIVPFVVVLGVLVIALLILVFRWLQFDGLDPDMARVRGIPVRLTGLAFLLALALAVALSALSIGAVLSTALLIGPAAAALRLTRRLGSALAVAASFGVVSLWAGVAISYSSFYWAGGGRSWPVSFCVVAVVVLIYLATGPVHELVHRHRRDPVTPQGHSGHGEYGSHGILGVRGGRG